MSEALTVAEVAALLRVSTSVIYDLCAAGKLPHFRVGLGRGTIRIEKKALDSLLSEGVKRFEPIGKMTIEQLEAI